MDQVVTQKMHVQSSTDEPFCGPGFEISRKEMGSLFARLIYLERTSLRQQRGSLCLTWLGKVQSAKGNNSSAESELLSGGKVKRELFCLFPSRRPTLRHLSGNSSLSDQTHMQYFTKEPFFNDNTRTLV